MLALIKLRPFDHGHTNKLVRIISVIMFLLTIGIHQGSAMPGQLLSANTTLPVSQEKNQPEIAQIVRNYKPAGDDVRSRIIDLISYSIGFYTEEMILWGKPIVVFRHNPEQQF